METKNVPTNTVTRKLTDLDSQTGNIYESIVVISKRANQIGNEMKRELHDKLSEYAAPPSDTLEETFENREQIEVSRHFERMPKPSIVATEEFLDGQVYFRDTKNDEPEPKIEVE